MSRMSKYLRQKGVLQRVKLNPLKEPVMNVYGELEYDKPTVIKCRREKYLRDVEGPNGAMIKSSNQYYTTIEIGLNDKLDDKVILSVEEYTNEFGEAEGYRSIT